MGQVINLEGEVELQPLNVKEAAALTGFSVRTIRAWAHAGHVKSWRAGGKGNAPLLISRRSLLQHAGVKDGSEVAEVEAARLQLQPLQPLQELVNELRADKARLLEETTELRERVQDLEGELAQAKRDGSVRRALRNKLVGMLE